MALTLTVYTDDCLTDVKRVVEADKLKIPYRVSMTIIKALDGININSNDDVLKVITGNAELLDKIIKATFKVSDTELESVDTAEVLGTAMELVKWATLKVSSIKGDEKNAVAPVV